MALAPCVLVIDDDWDLLSLVRTALEMEGYVVQSAQNGMDALVLFERVRFPRPALVLTDLKMPLVHGWEFVRAFREQWGDAVPIVVMTGTSDLVPDELTTDVAAVLRKPFDLDMLLNIVAYHIRQPRPA